MQKVLYRILLIISFVSLLTFSNIAFGDDPPPPPGGHGETGNKGPTGSPIGGGLAVFMAFAAGYAGREWYKGRKSKTQADEQ